MERGAWILKLKPGQETAYRKAHEQVWPELIAAAVRAGMRNHSVYVKGSLVFAYAEAENLKATMEILAASDVTRRWNEFMSQYMEDPDGESLDDVCHFD
jgi:L-rhamnose mutarotase